MTSQQMAILQKKWQELSAAEPSDKTTSQLAAVEQRILSTQKKLDGLNAKWSEMHTRSSTVLKKLGSGFGKVFGKIRSVGAKAFSSLGSKISGVGKSALSVIKPVNKLGTTLKNTFKRVFVMAGLYAAFRALKDGFIETAKADERSCGGHKVYCRVHIGHIRHDLQTGGGSHQEAEINDRSR